MTAESTAVCDQQTAEGMVVRPAALVPVTPYTTSVDVNR